jgi:hypothetical protein
MKITFKSILLICVYFVAFLGFSQKVSKYEVGIKVGNYYNFNYHFRRPRFSNSEAVYVSRDFSKSARLEMSFQRGAFQFFAPGFSTFPRGVNSNYTDNTISCQSLKLFKLKKDYNLSFGVGLACTWHKYIEPGYNVYLVNRGSGGLVIWTTEDNIVFKSNSISMPLSLNIHRQFNSKITLRASLQHYFTPYYRNGFGYGTSLSVGMGYRL